MVKYIYHLGSTLTCNLISQAGSDRWKETWERWPTVFFTAVDPRNEPGRDHTLRKIFHINLDVVEFKDTKNCVQKSGGAGGTRHALQNSNFKSRRYPVHTDSSRGTRYTCLIEALESTRTRIGMTQLGDRAHLVAEKGFNSLSSKACAQAFSYLPRHENSGCESSRARVGKA